MAVTFLKQTIHDGPRNLVVKVVFNGDGTDITTAAVLINVSDYAGPTPGVGASVKVMKIDSALDGFAVNLLWDATTDVEFATCPAGEMHQDFNSIGGLVNNSGSAISGDIFFTTLGNAANENGTIILHMKKRDI